MKVRQLLLLIFLLLFACTSTGDEETPVSELTTGQPTPADSATTELTPPTPVPTQETTIPLPTEEAMTSTAPVTGGSNPIWQLRMVDRQNGWAVGARQTSQPVPILLTTDGGRTWERRTPAGAPASPAAMEVYPAAFFASAVAGWVSYPQILPQPNPADFVVWSTTDGGQSWSSSRPLDVSGVPMDYFIPSDLGFIDDGFGWLMAHLGAGMNHDYIAVFTTADGGRSWMRVSDPTNAPDIQSCVKTGLVFINAADGWLAGDCPGLMPPLVFYRTSDSGITWSRAFLPPPETLPDAAAENLGDRCGVPKIGTVAAEALYLILRCTDFEQNISQAWLYTSLDAGETWESRPLPLPPTLSKFITPDEGWLLGPESESSPAEQELFHTSDGGRTWESLAVVAAGNDIDFADAQNGWLAAKQPFLLYTDDGGRSWQELPFDVLP